MNSKTPTLLMTLAILSAPAGAQADPTSTKTHCEPPALAHFQNPNIQAALRDLHAAKTSPIEALAEGWAVRRFSKSERERSEAEYLIAFALSEAQLPHPAYRGFSALAQKVSARPNFAPEILEGTWTCLAQLGEAHPSLRLPKNLVPYLPAFTHGSNERLKKAGRQLAFRILRSELRPGDSAPKAALLSLLEPDVALQAEAQAWLSARTHDVQSLIRETDRLQVQGPLSPELQLLRAQALYGARRYAEAADAFKKIEKKDNHSTDALQGLAWSHLQNERYGDAIGVASTLQNGALRKAFTPESWMVTAISLQELCQYADSLRAVQGYRKRYHEAHEWIQKWESAPTPLYGPTVRFLRTGQSGGVPASLATEWLRSPVFQKGQAELNLLLTQAAVISAEQKKAQHIQRSLRTEFVKAVTQLDSLPAGEDRKAAIEKVRQRLKLARRFDAASPLWDKITQKAQRATHSAQTRIVSLIQEDLSRRTRLAGAALQEIAENLERLEIEIYGEASEDIVWRQAHPEFQGRRSAQGKGLTAENANVWHWGTLASGEIWEDELDSFRADLSNHCDDKENHLNVLRKQLQKRASNP